MKKLFLILLVFIVSCSGFTKLPPETENALQMAGKNFKEVFNAIVRYKDVDSLKFAAANFLVANAQYKQFADNVNGVMICDVNYLTEQFLTQNIDSAFLAYQKTWNKNLVFEDFKEFLLPYKFLEEKPDYWRGKYAAEYESFLTDTITTAESAAKILNAAIVAKGMDFTDCGDFALRTAKVMRSCGIPVGVALIPHWGTKGNSHIFNILKTENGFVDFLGGEDSFGRHLDGFHDNIPKIYMLCFSKQDVIFPREDKPSLFRNMFLKDITADILCNTKDLSVEINSRGKLAYLCVFDTKGWCPVSCAEIKNKIATFADLGTGVVYQLATFDEGKLLCYGNPFLLNADGTTSYYIPAQKTFNQILTRKSPESNRWEEVEKQIPGGKFQGANREDFKDSVTLFTITETPDLKFQQAEIINTQKFKYLRYLSSNKTYGNMAEVEFYGTDNKIMEHKRVFGRYKPSLWFPDFTAEKLFDGDVLTFFHTSDSLSWGAIELSAPQAVSKIRYKIRNDDNGIRKGEIYELLYANNGFWLSLGKITAEKDDEILFENLPEGALFWLRDLSKGTEERIFEIKDGEVQWR